MAKLRREEWGRLTQNQRWALEILNKSADAAISPECPLSMKTAMHDMWRFGFAERKFNPDCEPRLSYQITFLGRRAASEILKQEVQP